MLFVRVRLSLRWLLLEPEFFDFPARSGLLAWAGEAETVESLRLRRTRLPGVCLLAGERPPAAAVALLPPPPRPRSAGFGDVPPVLLVLPARRRGPVHAPSPDARRADFAAAAGGAVAAEARLLLSTTGCFEAAAADIFRDTPAGLFWRLFAGDLPVSGLLRRLDPGDLLPVSLDADADAALPAGDTDEATLLRAAYVLVRRGVVRAVNPVPVRAWTGAVAFAGDAPLGFRLRSGGLLGVAPLAAAAARPAEPGTLAGDGEDAFVAGRVPERRRVPPPPAPAPPPLGPFASGVEEADFA